MKRMVAVGLISLVLILTGCDSEPIPPEFKLGEKVMRKSSKREGTIIDYHTTGNFIVRWDDMVGFTNQDESVYRALLEKKN